MRRWPRRYEPSLDGLVKLTVRGDTNVLFYQDTVRFIYKNHALLVAIVQQPSDDFYLRAKQGFADTLGCTPAVQVHLCALGAVVVRATPRLGDTSPFYHMLAFRKQIEEHTGVLLYWPGATNTMIRSVLRHVGRGCPKVLL